MNASRRTWTRTHMYTYLFELCQLSSRIRCHFPLPAMGTKNSTLESHEASPESQQQMLPTRKRATSRLNLRTIPHNAIRRTTPLPKVKKARTQYSHHDFPRTVPPVLAQHSPCPAPDAAPTLRIPDRVLVGLTCRRAMPEPSSTEDSSADMRTPVLSHLL